LQVAVAAHQAAEFIGMPEASLILAHAVLYVATAPKSNSATVAIGKAQAEVAEGRTLAVPRHLRDTHYKGSKQLAHGEGYLYAHDFPGGFVPQAYLPEGRIYYQPTDHGREKIIRERLAFWRSQYEGAGKKK
jgi:putative ATPase